MDWSKLHAQSEKLATDAHLAFEAGRTSYARNLFEQAAQLEQNALDLVDEAKARTRGVTAISAVALWLKAGKYNRAQQLASSMISYSKIPAFACEELRKIVQAIRTAEINF